MAQSDSKLSPRETVEQATRPSDLPGLGMTLRLAHPESRLSRLGGQPPYWAYAWAGGLVLAQFLQARPELVRGRGVLDIGSGSGLVAIAAAKAGAARVFANDIDPLACTAIGVNAAVNGVSVETSGHDLLSGPPPGDVYVILGGDVFYDARLATRMLRFLTRCAAGGILVLIGDPNRKTLPRAELREVFRSTASDFGLDRDRPSTGACVYALVAQGPAAATGSAAPISAAPARRQ